MLEEIFLQRDQISQSRSVCSKADDPTLWPPEAKCQLIGKETDARKKSKTKTEGSAEDEMVR